MIGAIRNWAVRYEFLFRMSLGLFFLIAAALKFTQTATTQNGFEAGVHAFASVIERGGVVPPKLAMVTAIAVLSIEVVIGIGLLSHRVIKLWTSVTILFLFVLTAYLLFLQIRGKTQACGCLGQWDTSIPIGIMRNALLSLACVPSLLAKPSVQNIDAEPAHPASPAG